MREQQTVTEEHLRSVGSVKWFGGHNSKTGADNNYGFIEDLSGRDVYLHKDEWKGTAGPHADQILTYSLEKDGLKWRAGNVHPLDKSSLQQLLELLELFADSQGKPLSHKHSKYYENILTRISVRISEESAETIRVVFSDFDVSDSLFEVLEKKNEWNTNRQLLMSAGLLDSFIARRKAEEQAKDKARFEKEALEKEKSYLSSKIQAEFDKDYLATLKMLSIIDNKGLLNHSELTLSWLRRYFSKQGYSKLSDEQILAIGDCSHSTLLRARAGSGKTTVIKHKIDFLIRHLGVIPSEIMALAFNADAAGKIRREIQEEFGHVTFTNARTFHSLAYKIVRPKEDLLFDEGTGSNAKQSQLVQDIVRLEANPSFRRELYNFFREEMKELEDTGSLLNKEDFYRLQRSCTQDTLKGETVKSLGEKWIADFLFEHGINYVYERSWYIDGDKDRARYHPDFSLAVWSNKPDIVIEHWGIDELDSSTIVPASWNKTWNEYHSEMQVKRKYWKDWNENNPDQKVIFLETSVRDLKNGRDSFERHLFKLLSDSGAQPRRLSDEEIIEKVVNKHITKFSKMCLQFISHAKKQLLSSEDVRTNAREFSFSCPKEKSFALLAFRIYQRYERELQNRNLIDFDDLVARAAECIRDSNANLHIQDGPENSVALKSTKWLLIDEYQDFSKLFFNIISALRDSDTEFSLFCVGDDWQAINGFAGSNLRYFQDFSQYFPQPMLLDLQNNYRSQPEVVSQGNKFMKGTGGKPSITKSQLFSENINRLYTNKVFIEQRRSSLEDGDADNCYKTYMQSNGNLIDLDKGGTMARLFKAVHTIMANHELSETSFMILSRSNYLGYRYENMSKFKSKLKTCFSSDQLSQFRKFEDQVVCKTAHSSKGAEADVVIVLNVLDKKFPILHPDNELFRLFGTSIDDVYMEEERLFYVAITRAKQSLYLLTEVGRESEFLDRIATSELAINKDLKLYPTDSTGLVFRRKPASRGYK